MLLEAGGPETGMMMSMMGTETFMKYIISGYNMYKQEKEIERRRKQEERETQ